MLIEMTQPLCAISVPPSMAGCLDEFSLYNLLITNVYSITGRIGQMKSRYLSICPRNHAYKLLINMLLFISLTDRTDRTHYMLFPNHTRAPARSHAAGITNNPSDPSDLSA